VRRRPAFWAAVGVALLAVAGGGAIATSGPVARASPASVVRDYFAALARDDAPAALALGPVPRGPHLLLTSAALRAQQRRAPIRDVVVTPATARAATALVRVRYHLGYASGDVAVASTVALHRHGDSWQLDHSAVRVSIDVSTANRRASLFGGRVPTRTLPMFPGAVPIDFDSPYLEVRPATDGAGFGDHAVQLEVAISPAGRRAIDADVLTVLQACLTGRAGAAANTCPEPDERVIPGSVRGRITGPVRHENLVLSPGAEGGFEYFATVPTRVSYQRLDFRNVVQTHRGQELIAVHAVGYAVTPVQVQWAR
jgi:hypothetical protein